MYSHIEDKNYNHLVCVILGGSEKECKLHGLAHVGEHMCLLSCFDNDESYTTFGYTCIDHAVLYFASKKQDSLYKIQSMIEDKSIVREDRVEIAKHQVISECENLSSKICVGESAVRFITDSVVVVFMGNRTVIDFLITPITNIRCSIQTIATFFFEVVTCLVTSRTGRTFNPTKNNFVTSIRFSTMISMNTEVLFIDERAFMIPVRDSSCFNFFRDSSWIFAEENSTAHWSGGI